MPNGCNVTCPTEGGGCGQTWKLFLIKESERVEKTNNKKGKIINDAVGFDGG